MDFVVDCIYLAVLTRLMSGVWTFGPVLLWRTFYEHVMRPRVWRKPVPSRRELTKGQCPSIEYCGPWYSYLNSRWSLESSVDPLPGSSVDQIASIAKEPAELLEESSHIDGNVENEPLKEEDQEKAKENADNVHVHGNEESDESSSGSINPKESLVETNHEQLCDQAKQSSAPEGKSTSGTSYSPKIVISFSAPELDDYLTRFSSETTPPTETIKEAVETEESMVTRAVPMKLPVVIAVEGADKVTDLTENNTSAPLITADPAVINSPCVWMSNNRTEDTDTEINYDDNSVTHVNARDFFPSSATFPVHPEIKEHNYA